MSVDYFFKMKGALVAACVVLCIVYFVGIARFLLLFLGLVVVLLVFMKTLLDKVFFHIPIVPSPASWQVDDSSCSLFRFIPELRGRVAYRPLGVFPTPLHHVDLVLPNGRRFSLLAKREDLSSDFYGGNKVRTLEFQLACASAVACMRGGGSMDVYTIGAPGSNQVVAVAAHVHRTHPELNVHPLYAMPEAAQPENGLNAYSVFSWLNPAGKSFWMLEVLPLLVKKTFFQSDSLIIPPGGKEKRTLCCLCLMQGGERCKHRRGLWSYCRRLGDCRT